MWLYLIWNFVVSKKWFFWTIHYEFCGTASLHLVSKSSLQYMQVPMSWFACILDRMYFVERSIHLIDEHWVTINTFTGFQASGVIIDRLLRQCCFVWSEIIAPYSSSIFNEWPLKLKAGSKIWMVVVGMRLVKSKHILRVLFHFFCSSVERRTNDVCVRACVRMYVCM